MSPYSLGVPAEMTCSGIELTVGRVAGADLGERAQWLSRALGQRREAVAAA